MKKSSFSSIGARSIHRGLVVMIQRPYCPKNRCPIPGTGEIALISFLKIGFIYVSHATLYFIGQVVEGEKRGIDRWELGRAKSDNNLIEIASLTNKLNADDNDDHRERAR